MNRARRRLRARPTFNCLECGREKVKYRVWQKYCGPRCRFRAWARTHPRTAEEIPPHAVPTPIAVFIEGRGWPNEAVFPRGNTYDALKFISDEATGETIYQDWDDDVFEIPG